MLGLLTTLMIASSVLLAIFNLAGYVLAARIVAWLFLISMSAFCWMCYKE